MSKRLNPMDEKFQKDKLCFKRITNEDLKCKDCKYRFDDTVMIGNTCKRKQYDIKPATVIDGGDCDLYRKGRA